MRLRIAPAAPVLLGTGWLLSLFLPLLSPGRALANRDIALFHLPLRAAFRRLAGSGLPVWNPWLHGGQPILSNPSYAAFYPPSWLALAVPPAYALSLLAVFHAALAFAGAWVLARRLGAGRGAAALAALGYTGSGATLSLLNAYTLFCSMAWFPWVLAAGDAVLRAPARRGWLRPALLGGLALGLQLLNGEPVTVVVSGLGLLALAASAAVESPRAVPRLLVPVAVAMALAAVQLLPTWGRLADSPRGGGLDARQAGTWSAPPVRLVELVFPRFFGDPAEPQEGRFFGWNLHDRDYPYVASLYPGLLLTVLGVSALALWPIPRRAAWAAGVLGGCFLALGRHNPLYEGLRRTVPLLGMLRFPEKFAILAVASLAFAGALGWQRLAAEREAGRRAAADFPLVLSLVLLATALTLTAVLYGQPRAALWFIRRHGGPTLTDTGALGGLAYLRGEAWAAVLTTAAVALLFALCRARRPSARALTAAAVALLAADLWHYGHGLVVTLPAAEVRDPPPLAGVVPPESRLYVQPAPAGQPDLVLRSAADDARLAPVRALMARLEPYSGSLWGISYALNEDFDLMLTGWGRVGMTIIDAEWKQPDLSLAYRFLGAWNVGAMLLRKTPGQWAAEVARDRAALPVRVIPNPYRLPRYRFAPKVGYQDSFGSALYLSRREGYEVQRHEHAVREGEAPGEVDYPVPPQPLRLVDTGGRIRLRYRAPGKAFFVVATTWDEGWRASVDGAPVRSYLTGLGQIGVELPAGEHALLLEYRDPLVGIGAAVSLLTLAACAVVLGRGRRRRGLRRLYGPLSFFYLDQTPASLPEGLPRQPEGLPVQPEGLPVQPEGLPVRQEGLPVRQEGLPVQPEGSPARQEGSLPRAEGFPPQPEGLPVRQEGLPVQPEGLPVQQEGFRP
jgi:hypothetical protein